MHPTTEDAAMSNSGSEPDTVDEHPDPMTADPSSSSTAPTAESDFDSASRIKRKRSASDTVTRPATKARTELHSQGWVQRDLICDVLVSLYTNEYMIRDRLICV